MEKQEVLLQLIRKLGREVEAGLFDAETFTLSQKVTELAAEVVLKRKVSVNLQGN